MGDAGDGPEEGVPSTTTCSLSDPRASCTGTPLAGGPVAVVHVRKVTKPGWPPVQDCS